MNRGKSTSTGLAQRVPLGPGRGQVAPPVANAVHAARIHIPRVRVPVATGPRRVSRIVAEQIREQVQLKEEDSQSEMEVEEEDDVAADYDEDQSVNEQEVETMVGIDELDTDGDQDEIVDPPSTVEPKTRCIWPQMDTKHAERYRKEIQAIREVFEEEIDMYDTAMVSEYSDEIFEYMNQLEVGFPF